MNVRTFLLLCHCQLFGSSPVQSAGADVTTCFLQIRSQMFGSKVAERGWEMPFAELLLPCCLQLTGEIFGPSQNIMAKIFRQYSQEDESTTRSATCTHNFFGTLSDDISSGKSSEVSSNISF